MKFQLGIPSLSFNPGCPYNQPLNSTSKNKNYKKFFINWQIKKNKKKLEKQSVSNKTNSCKYKKTAILTK